MRKLLIALAVLPLAAFSGGALAADAAAGEAKAETVLALPMHPYLDAATQDRIVEAIRGFNG